MEAASNDRKAVLFQLWLKGEVNWEQEQELLQLAADDPFLAEAMEGYESLPEANHLGAIDQLKEQVLQEEQKTPRIFPIPYFSRIAAALLIAVSLIWLWNSYQPFSAPNASEEIALEQAPPSPSATAPIVEAAEEEKEAEVNNRAPAVVETPREEPSFLAPPPEQSHANTIQVPEVNRTEDRSAPPATPGRIVEAEQALATAKPKSQENQARRKEAKESDPVAVAKAEELAQPAADVAAEEAAPPSYAEDTFFDTDLPANEPVQIRVLAETDKEDPSIIKGTVKGDFDKALRGVVIFELGTQNGTISDRNGNFQLQLKEEDSKYLEFSIKGFQPRLVEIEKANNTDIVLNNTAKASETTTGARAKAKKRTAPALPEQLLSEEHKPFAAPIGGFQAYEKYIRKNKKYPSEARKNKIKGLVKLSFQIDQNGVPINIKILQSLGYGCDEEAIRLLQEGPKWIRVVEEATEFSYEIRFER